LPHEVADRLAVGQVTLERRCAHDQVVAHQPADQLGLLLVQTQPRAEPLGDFGRARDRDDRGWLDRAGETVASWFGGEDDEERIRRLDLRDRAQAAGGRVVLNQDSAVVGHAIFTRHEHKMQHLTGVDYSNANERNRVRSLDNLAAGRWRANA
jgi:hypothetical protein